MYLNNVQQMVSGELAGESLQTGFDRHGLPPQRDPLDTVHPVREHLNSVQRMLSGGYCEGLSPDMVYLTRLRNTWGKIWKNGKDPHPQDKIQHLDFTKDTRPLYYKTPPCAFCHKDVRSKAVFGP